MIRKFFSESLIIDDYEIDGKSYVNCVIRKKRVKFTPEEEVRQAILIYLLNICEANTSMLAVKVEYMSLDIAIYNKDINNLFAPHKYPLLIIELKRRSCNVLNFESQLTKYLKTHWCKDGILTNCSSMYAYKLKDKEYIKRKIIPSDIATILSGVDESDSDLHAFNEATHGDVDSFLFLIGKYSKNNIITFQSVEFKQPVNAICVSHSGPYVFFDIQGVKSKRNQRKSRLDGFIKLNSIKSL